MGQGNVSPTIFSPQQVSSETLPHHIPRSLYRSLETESQGIPSLPIYQTSRQAALTSRLEYPGSVIPTYNLLPSCLQDVIQSPVLSPTTSSASTSPENSHDDHHYDYELPSESRVKRDYHYPHSPGVMSNSSSSSIWKIDGEESKSLAFSAPNSANSCVSDLVTKFSSGFSFA